MDGRVTLQSADLNTIWSCYCTWCGAVQGERCEAMSCFPLQKLQRALINSPTMLKDQQRRPWHIQNCVTHIYTHTHINIVVCMCVCTHADNNAAADHWAGKPTGQRLIACYNEQIICLVFYTWRAREEREGIYLHPSSRLYCAAIHDVIPEGRSGRAQPRERRSLLLVTWVICLGLVK